MAKCCICGKESVIRTKYNVPLFQEGEISLAICDMDDRAYDVKGRHYLCEECYKSYMKLIAEKRKGLYEKLHKELNKLDNKVIKQLKKHSTPKENLNSVMKEKVRLTFKLKDGQNLGYIQKRNGECYYGYTFAEATLFDPVGVLNLLNKTPFDKYDVFAEVPYTTDKGRKGKIALKNEELKTYMQNELNDKSEQVMENKTMKKQVNEQMYDELGNAITPEEYAKGVADGTVNEAKEVDEHEVNELVLYMENTQKHYNSIMAVVKNLAKKMAKGNFDKELAVKGMMYPVNDGARAYKKEFSGEGYEKYDFNPATRKAAAEELLDRYMEDIEDMAGTKNISTDKIADELAKMPDEEAKKIVGLKNEMYDEYGNHITPEEYAKGVANGTINESFKLSKSDKEYLKSIGNDDEDLPQIEKVGRSKKTKFELDDTEITSDEAIKVLGKEKFLAGLSRCAFHKSAKQSNNGKSVHFVCESVEDEADDNMLALEDYLVSSEGEDPSEVEIKSGYTDNLYDTPWGEYYVFGSYEEAEQAAIEYEKEVLDDIGIDALNWNYMPYEIGHYVDRNWFQEAMEESNQFYIDDIKHEEGRLEEEMADAGVETEEEYLEHLNNNYADPIDWYRDNFGDEDFNQVVKEKNLVDLDAVAESVVEVDGPANALAGYDGNEIEWEFNGNYYYIYRNN